MMDHQDQGLGEMQSSSTGRLDHNLSKSAIEDSSRMDSGISLTSFRSDSSRLNSEDFDRHQSTSSSRDPSSLLHTMPPLAEVTSFDSGCAPSLKSVPSLNSQLQNLRLEEESVPAAAPAPAPWRPMTLAELRGRTKEQKLRDMDACNLMHRKEVKPPKQSENLNCDSIRCSSLTEEEERPPHFEQDADGDTLLHLLIVHGETDQVEHIIETCPSWTLLNIRNELGQTGLHLAVLTNQPLIARKLLIHGAALDIRDRQGNTPLHLACRDGLLDCAVAITRKLKQKETAEVKNYPVPFQQIPQPMDLQNYNGKTVMQLAAEKKEYFIMRHLVIECRANINEADWKSGRTLLHVAAETNNSSLAEFLLSHPRINLDARTYEGHTPLRLAMGRLHTDVIQLLLLNGATPEDSDETDDEDECMQEDMPSSTDSDVDDGFDDMEFQGQAIFPR